MKNAYTVGGISCQLQKVCERIDTLTHEIVQSEESSTELADLYTSHLLDELGHAQDLVLKMTELAVEATGETGANADEGEGSVFAEGDLTAAKGEKPKAGEGEE